MVDDFEIAATRKFLEFNKGEIWFNASGVAIHYQTDRAGRGNNGCLGIAVTILLSQLHCIIPGLASSFEHIIRTIFCFDSMWLDAEANIGLVCIIGSGTVVSHDPQHVFPVLSIARKRSVDLGDLSRSLVRNTCHDG